MIQQETSHACFKANEKIKPENIDPLLVYSDYFAAYRESWFNQQRWMKYIQDKSDSNQFLILYAIPITEKQYIVAEFTTAPNNDVGVRGLWVILPSPLSIKLWIVSTLTI